MLRLAFLLVLLVLLGETALADTVVASRNLRPGTVLLASDIVQISGEVPGSYAHAESVVGLEAKVAIYAGRPILNEQLGAPATVERNQLVELVYEKSGLSIRTEGRALGRGSEGQRIRVMNLFSKASLFGTVQANGTIRVSQ